MPGQNGQFLVITVISVVFIASFFSSEAQAQPGSRSCVGPGEVCGGIAGIGCCDESFYCYIPNIFPDAQGRCVPKCAYPPTTYPRASGSAYQGYPEYPSNSSNPRPCAGSGQVCGGFEGKTCCQNLSCCTQQPTNMTDAPGTCMSSCPSPPPKK